MCDIAIRIRDIGELTKAEVRDICDRLSWPLEHALPDSMQPEVIRRHVSPEPGPHASITMALVYHNNYLVAWAATRPFFEKFKGDLIAVQTIECFTDRELRNRGFAQIGLNALISAGQIARNKPVSVYHASVVKIAERCGCKCVILCNARDDENDENV
jgi:hypothetical protein